MTCLALIQRNLIILCNCNILLNPKGPIDMQNILVECQHKDYQDEEGVEHSKEKHRLVSQFFKTSSNKSLKQEKLKTTYFKGFFIYCNVLPDTERPLQVDFVLIQS